MLKVFISYTHADEQFQKQLVAHLSPFIRNKSLEIWFDRKLLGGDLVDDSIMTKLEDCDLFLALVSPEFIASDYCFERELARARELHDQGLMRLLPIILRACQWHQIPALAKLLATPKDGQAVASWTDRDEAFNDVAREIGRIVTSPKTSNSKSSSPASRVQVSDIKTRIEHNSEKPAIEKLGLVIPKRPPTDRDRDNFRRQSFQAIFEIFEVSIAQAMVKGEVEGEIRRLDANRFCAVLYVNGRKVSAITIRSSASGLGGNGISYVNEEDADTNTTNGWYTISDKDGELFFNPNVFYSHGRIERQLSDSDVAAEMWGQLISPLNQRLR